MDKTKESTPYVKLPKYFFAFYVSQFLGGSESKATNKHNLVITTSLNPPRWSRGQHV